MPTDMVPARFYDELNALQPFSRIGTYDSCIATAPLPPKQAFLPGLFLYGHARGYHLPSWNEFQSLYIDAVTKHFNFKKTFARNFDIDTAGTPTPKPGLLFRMSGWYEDSIARAFLYSVLVLAYEVLDQSSIVLFDARADWKFKADFVIIQCAAATKAIGISIAGQNEDNRAKVEEDRGRQEREMKVNNSESSQWDNSTYDKLPLVTITKSRGVVNTKNNIKLFSLEAMEGLMTDIDAMFGLARPAVDTSICIKPVPAAMGDRNFYTRRARTSTRPVGLVTDDSFCSAPTSRSAMWMVSPAATSCIPVQQAFCDRDALMCGFCTPGFIMASVALLEKNPNPTPEQIKKGLDGNICRCGTFSRIFEAVSSVKGGQRG